MHILVTFQVQPFAPVPQGWQCPVCQHVMSPSVAVCMFCPPKAETFITKDSGTPEAHEPPDS